VKLNNSNRELSVTAAMCTVCTMPEHCIFACGGRDADGLFKQQTLSGREMSTSKQDKL